MSFRIAYHPKGVLRGVGVVLSANNREGPGWNLGRGEKSVGDFSYTLNLCPLSSEWVPGVMLRVNL